MKDKYINDIEPIIINWLKSGNENTTQITYDICEYFRNEINIAKKISVNSFMKWLYRGWDRKKFMTPPMLVKEYFRNEVKINSDLDVDEKPNTCPKCNSNNTINYNTPSCTCLECNTYWAI